jgi:hypothetical protein
VDSKKPKRLPDERADDRGSKKPKKHRESLTSQQLSRKMPALSSCSLRGSTGLGSCLHHASSDITKYNTSSPSQSSLKGSVGANPHLHPSSSSATTDSNNNYNNNNNNNNNNNTYMNLSGSKKRKEARLQLLLLGFPGHGQQGVRAFRVFR